MKYFVFIVIHLKVFFLFAQNNDSIENKEFRHIELIKKVKYIEDQCMMSVDVVNSTQDAINIGGAYISLMNSKTNLKIKKEKTAKAVLIDNDFWKVDLIKQISENVGNKKKCRDVKFTVYIRRRNGALLLYTDDFKI
jgi:hypothetical protein